MIQCLENITSLTLSIAAAPLFSFCLKAPFSLDCPPDKVLSSQIGQLDPLCWLVNRFQRV